MEQIPVNPTEFQQLVAQLEAKKATLPSSAIEYGRSSLVPDLEHPGNASVQEMAEKTFESLVSHDIHSPLTYCFEPSFIRPPPPLSLSEQELIWMNPTDCIQSIHWDNSMCMDNRSVVVRKLLGKIT